MFILNRIVFVFNSMAILALLGSYLAPYVSPELIWHIAFLGLAYPVILLINILFIIYWLIFMNMRFLFSMAAIVIGWNHIPHFVQFSEKKHTPETTENSLNIITFNAKYFGMLDRFTSNEESLFIEKITRLKPDIMCAQEYHLPIPGYYSNSLSLKTHDYFKKFNVSNGTKQNKVMQTDNLIIYSRHKIIQSGVVERAIGSGNYTIFADMVKNQDTFRIITTHLQSIGFSKPQYDAILSLMGEKDSINFSELKSVGSKMKYAYLLRAAQVESIRKFIDDSPYRVILCGDFNDSPVSYAYRNLSGDLKDAFMEAGSGLGRTYVGAIPSLRIDYILADPSFKFFNYYAKGFDFSDHKLVSCTVTW